MKPKCCKNNHRKEELAQATRDFEVVGPEYRLEILCVLQGGEHCACKSSNILICRKFGSASFEQIKKSGIDQRPERRRLDPLFIDRKGQENNGKYFKNNQIINYPEAEPRIIPTLR